MSFLLVKHKHEILFQVKMDLSLLLSLHVFVAVATWQVAGGVTNLLVNPSFEEPLENNWGASASVVERITGDVRDGNYSIKCYNRYAEHSHCMHSLSWCLLRVPQEALSA